ncbi:hypothetical protein PASE110613_01135 [Paenibacillus sediminis]|uniref:Uncharacterized protein n=1 Tax=Paenibacillus sediminis TaxID=664909 RepID=A0ABS4GZX6_9BACL|nr:hypothetical protein [Paenibacillus sediminis]MBP1935814.1 hypothetical protein [Paenibacillus sediminis]
MNGENCYTLKDFIDYINGQCSPQREEELELILEHDDHATLMYIEALEIAHHQLPILNHQDQFVESVMDVLPQSPIHQLHHDKSSKRKWFENPLFHYTVAACLTLIFLSAGWFDRLAPEAIDTVAYSSESALSNELMSITEKWLDRIKP